MLMLELRWWLVLLLVLLLTEVLLLEVLRLLLLLLLLLLLQVGRCRPQDSAHPRRVAHGRLAVHERPGVQLLLLVYVHGHEVLRVHVWKHMQHLLVLQLLDSVALLWVLLQVRVLLLLLLLQEMLVVQVKLLLLLLLLLQLVLLLLLLHLVALQQQLVLVLPTQLFCRLSLDVRALVPFRCVRAPLGAGAAAAARGPLAALLRGRR